MSISGISTNNQTLCGRNESPSSQNGNNNSTGWKYVTVTDGDTVYTYIVIGKNMKVLIGKSTTKQDKDKDKNDDKETASNKKDTVSNSDKTRATEQNNNNKKAAEKNDFLIDERMLALTGYYQKKMRKLVDNLEDKISRNNGDGVDSRAKVEHTIYQTTNKE